MIGLTTGFIYRMNFLGIQNFTFPAFIRRFCSTYIRPLLTSSPPLDIEDVKEERQIWSTVRRGRLREELSTVTPTPENITKIVALGFDECVIFLFTAEKKLTLHCRQQAVAALSVSDNDLERAINHLLAQ